MSAEIPEHHEPASSSSTTASGHDSVAVGGDVHDSTIITGDSNVIYLGAHDTPRKISWRRALLVGAAVAAIAGVAAVGYVVYPRPIPTMSGDLNVAVAEFGALDTQGAAVQSTEGRSLADSLFGTLAGELQTINDTSPNPAEQHFLIQVWGPAQVGRIDGKTPDARAAAAEQLATRSKAHLVVYGYFQQVAGGSTFVPQFFLRNLQDSPELEGQHDLGGSVVLRSLDDPSSRSALRGDLTDRTRAFAELVIGLSQYANDRFSDARVHFSTAEADPQWGDSKGSGKEVLYLFLGYTAGKLQDLGAAQESFEHALRIEPELARAYLGLGEVRFQQSLGKPEACAHDTVDVGGIQTAVNLYQRSLSASVQPDRSDVPATTALGLGRAYLCLSQADQGDHWSDAEREFKIVVANFARDTSDETARDLAADAHSNLGFVYLPIHCDADRDNKYRKAAAEYQLAVDLSPLHPARQAFFYSMLGFIDTNLNQLDQARTAYQNASRVDPGNRDHYAQLAQNVAAPAAETCP